MSEQERKGKRRIEIAVLSITIIALVSLLLFVPFEPQLDIEIAVAPRPSQTIQGYAFQIAGNIGAYPKDDPNGMRIGWKFSSGTTDDTQLFTDISEPSGFWKIGQEYRFTIYSGNYTDAFIFTLGRPWRNGDAQSPFTYVKTEHFYITFRVISVPVSFSLNMASYGKNPSSKGDARNV